MARPKNKNTVVRKTPVKKLPVKNPLGPKKEKLPFNFFNLWTFANVFAIKQKDNFKFDLEIIPSKYHGEYGYSVIKKRGKYLQE